MKMKMLDMLVAMALGQLYMVEKTAGAKVEKEQEEFSIKVPEKVASWHEQGKKEGKKVHDAIEKGEMITREVLLVYGQHLATEHDSDGQLPPAATDWLTGYASAWTNPNTAKARKTEAKAVFDAFALRDEERELVVGYTNADPKSKEERQPIKETQSIGEWLMQHNDVKGKEGYRGLVDFAKELRGPASGRGSSGGANRGPRAVTPKQQVEIEQRVEVMNPNQAHSVAQRATAQLAKLPGFEIVMFRQIVNACDMITNKSTDEALRNRASAIRDMADEMVEKLKAAMKATTDAKASTTSASGTPGAKAPAPATPVSESGSAAPAPATDQQKAA